ncbi:MAG: class I SAM-dependent RNA methyltransferase [Acidobacteriota bacterium]
MAGAAALRLRVEKVVAGGYGLARQPLTGETVLVPFVLPDETIEVRKTYQEKGVKWARAEHLLEPNPHRREAPCPYYGDCGGCDLQHADYAYQIEIKGGALLETLRRVGRVDWHGPVTVVRSPEFGYRIRATLKAAWPGGRLDIGFYRNRSRVVCAVERCLLLVEPLNACLPHLKCTLETRALGRMGEIDALSTDEGVLLWLRTDREPPTGLVRDLARIPGCAGVGIVRDAGGRSAHRIVQRAGKDRAVLRVGRHAYLASPTCFFQANRFMHQALLDALDAVLPTSGRLALDLYCGAGFFTQHLGDRFETVVGVEENADAIRLARDAAEAAGMGGLRFLAVDVCASLRDPGMTGSPDVVVVDPPRAGLASDGSLIEYLGSMRPPLLVYFSCEPSTLARDLGRLRASGFQLVDLRAFDMFPQTHHLEAMAVLRPEDTARHESTTDSTSRPGA